MRCLQSSDELKQENATRLFAALLLSGGAVLGTWRAYKEYGREPSPPSRGLRSCAAAAVAGGFGGSVVGFSSGWAALFVGASAHQFGFPIVLVFAFSAVCSSNAALLAGSIIGKAKKMSDIDAFVFDENDRGWKLFQEGDVEGAMAAYKEVQRLDPYNSRASQDLGVVKEVRDTESKKRSKVEKPLNP